MSYYDTIKLGDGSGQVTLEVVNLTPSRVQKTIKQIIGRKVSQINILGATNYQWELNVSGVITDNLGNITAIRNKLLLLDDARGHTFIDSVHDGVYYIEPGSLQFTDDANNGQQLFRYTMTLIEV